MRLYPIILYTNFISIHFTLLLLYSFPLLLFNLFILLIIIGIQGIASVVDHIIFISPMEIRSDSIPHKKHGFWTKTSSFIFIIVIPQIINHTSIFHLFGNYQ